MKPRLDQTVVILVASFAVAGVVGSLAAGAALWRLRSRGLRSLYLAALLLAVGVAAASVLPTASYEQIPAFVASRQIASWIAEVAVVFLGAGVYIELTAGPQHSEDLG